MSTLATSRWLRAAGTLALVASCTGGGTTTPAPTASSPPSPSIAPPNTLPASERPSAGPPAATPSAASPAASGSPPSPAATSAGPRLGGSITYMQYKSDGAPEVWVACADLTNARQLTSVAGRGSGWSVWSPDGSRIVFDSDREDPDTRVDPVINDVFTMAADGTDVRKLTGSDGLSGDPAYSPDGALVAFEADAGVRASEGIFVADAEDGSEPRRLTTIPAGYSRDTAARFSPDGTQLVFTREKSELESSLFVIGLDGSGLREILTPGIRPGDATWSPDGTLLTFEAASPDFPYGSVWVVGVDGTGLTNLVDEPTTAGFVDGFADPVWSPDGTRIMLLHGLFRPDGTSTRGLATLRADGSDLAYVTDGLGDEHQPDWIVADNC